MEQNQRKQAYHRRGIVIAGVVLLVVVAVLLALSGLLGDRAQRGAKTVTIEVTLPGQGAKEFVLHTDAESLEQALTEAKLITGHTEQYGYFVESVAGRTADPAKGEWWVFTKGGEWVTTGVTDTMIADGDRYEFSIYAG